MRLPPSYRCAGALVVLGAALAPGAFAHDAEPHDGIQRVEKITVVGEQPATATGHQTVPAERFELRPLESGGQMLEAVPNVLTAQHTGGGKAEQYFLRGFDADHGTDLAVYFDGVPINLRGHAHGQGYIDLHFVTPETIDRLDAFKGPYSARYGDFGTAATIEYVPVATLDESLARVSYGEFDTLRVVGAVSPRQGPFEEGGPARGLLSFEAYHTDGPFRSSEDLWRYSAFARGAFDVTPQLTLSGHVLGYHADWNASGLLPSAPVRLGALDRFGSVDPTEGGDTTRVQGKLQLDWHPNANGRLTANAYLVYYDFELFSNFTYFLDNDDPAIGDGIVQRDRGRIQTGGRVEYVHVPDTALPVQLRAGLEARYDDARVLLARQTRRRLTTPISDDALRILSLDPYLDVQLDPCAWLGVQAGLRLAWLHADGRNALTDTGYAAEDELRWLPKATLTATPFAEEGPLFVDVPVLRDLEIVANFGLGHHSNDPRARFSGASGELLPRAIGAELGLRTQLLDAIEIALSGWYLGLDDELVFVGDEGTTESAGASTRAGIELASTVWLRDWWYLRGDVAYTWATLDAGGAPIPQAPRFIAKAATGVRIGGFAAELQVRHLGSRAADEARTWLRLSDYTVVDLGLRYRWKCIELGLFLENLTDTNWRSSEFFYASRPVAGGAATEDFHFTPGNPLNVRGSLTLRF